MITKSDWQQALKGKHTPGSDVARLEAEIVDLKGRLSLARSTPRPVAVKLHGPLGLVFSAAPETSKAPVWYPVGNPHPLVVDRVVITWSGGAE